MMGRIRVEREVREGKEGGENHEIRRKGEREENPGDGIKNKGWRKSSERVDKGRRRLGMR